MSRHDAQHLTRTDQSKVSPAEERDDGDSKPGTASRKLPPSALSPTHEGVRVFHLPMTDCMECSYECDCVKWSTNKSLDLYVRLDGPFTLLRNKLRSFQWQASKSHHGRPVRLECYSTLVTFAQGVGQVNSLFSRSYGGQSKLSALRARSGSFC